MKCSILYLTVLLMFFFGCSPMAKQKNKPNILLIMTDEMRWDYLGVAGHSTIKTPTLDELANSGYYFNKAYTPHPVCVPARVTLFTSRYGNIHGASNNGNNINQGELFLPSILKHFGYRTGLSGKLHFNPRGYNYGFDEFYSYTGEGEKEENTYLYYLKQHLGDISKYPVEDATRIYPNDPLGVDLGKFKHDFVHYESEWITRHGIEFLNKQTDDTPWFLFLSYNRPHSPSVLPEPYYSMYNDVEIELPELPGRFTRKDSVTITRARGLVEDPEMAERLIKSYMGAISLVDDKVAEVINLLETKGWDENTIVVFVSDHGNLLGDQGRWFKGPMWEGSSRIPFIVYVPENMRDDKLQSGRLDEVVELTDLMPTLLDLIGEKDKVKGMQGESLLNLMKGDKQEWRNTAYGNLSGQLMLVEGDYKYIHYDNKKGLPEWEVFNLKDDPKEQVNLANEKGIMENLPTIKSRMLERFNEQPPAMEVQGMKTPEYATFPRATKANDNVINEFGVKGKNSNVY